MKGRIASILIGAALVIGLGAGYFAHAGNTTTLTATQTLTTEQTLVSTVTLTTDQPQGSAILRCIITQYEVWYAALNTNSTSASNVFTTSYNETTYQITTATSEAAGFAETTTSYFTGTLTGPVELWNTTVCSYVSG